MSYPFQLGVRPPCVALLVLLYPSLAGAFSGVDSYRYPAGAAGGGNRYFTGSPRDGYTCKVCHEGGAPVRLDVRGLPLTAYQPDTTYEIVVDWPDDVANFAASVEVTDSQGRRAGAMILAPDAEVEPPEYCQPAVNELPAATVSLVPPETELQNFGYCSEPRELPADCRQIVSVADCGAKRLRFAWRAPSADIGRLWFAGSSVHSDENGDPSGDGVTDITRAMGSPSARNALASDTTLGCNLSNTRGSVAGAWFALVLGVFALARRRRPRRL